MFYISKNELRKRELIVYTKVLGMNRDELEEMVMSFGEQKFRSAQLFHWLHKKMIFEPDEMLNLPQSLKRQLKQLFKIENEKTNVMSIKQIESADANVVKHLLQLHDSNTIECVLMKHSYGNTVCVSSQVGCKMNCAFCASAMSFHRNLSPGEMLAQVYNFARHDKISNVVIMGSGEPFDNYDNALKFIRLINSHNGLNIGMRHITISTCGLVDKIYELANERLQVTLAISLHAPNDSLRQRLMPIANKHKVSDIIKACEFYFEQTSRRITFEYVLIAGVNDSNDNANELVKLLRNFPCHVNIIPVNQFKTFMPSKNKNFGRILSDAGIQVTVRKKFGDDINAACGQLKASYAE